MLLRGNKVWYILFRDKYNFHTTVIIPIYCAPKNNYFSGCAPWLGSKKLFLQIVRTKLGQEKLFFQKCAHLIKDKKNSTKRLS